MNWARIVRPLEYLALIVLIAAHFALYLVLPDSGQIGSSALVIVRDALPFSQAALIAIWLAVGPLSWFVRWPLALCSLVVFRIAITSPSPGVIDLRSLQNYVAPPISFVSMSHIEWRMVAAEVVVVAVGLVALRLAGFAMRRDERVAGRDLQFSLRSLMIATAVCAVSVWLAQWLRNRMDAESVVPEFLGVAIVSLTFAAVALLAVWATLSAKGFWLRMAVFVVVTPVLAAVPAYVCHRETDIGPMMLWTVAHAAIVAGSLLVVRTCGCRLIRSTHPATQVSRELTPARVPVAIEERVIA